MSKIIFGENEIKELKRNVNVQRVSEKSITYSDDFKRKLRTSNRNTFVKRKIIERQESKIKLLEEQLEMLKKLDMSERRLVKNCLNLKNNAIFKLIDETISNK